LLSFQGRFATTIANIQRSLRAVARASEPDIDGRGRETKAAASSP
jgi:hypothetical protein